MIHSIEDINSIAKDMKYEALYWALGYCEYEQGIFVKEYQNKFQVKIYVEYQNNLC